MKFVFHATALNGDDAVLDAIDRIVDRVSAEVHRGAVPDADLLQDSNWYETARPTRQGTLMEAAAVPPRKVDERGPHVKIVEVADAESARRAEKLAYTPLTVFVEDREADGVLLEIVIEELGWPALRALWERSREVTPRALEIVSAAGRDHIPQRVKRAASDAASEGRPPRIFALFDSDAKWPGDDDPELKKKRENVQETCDEHGVPFRAWRKRCAENYIPDKIFESVRDDLRNLNRAERFNALLRRKPKQRDHFPVKDGLSAKERSAAMNAGLYDHTDEADLSLLEERLFAKRPRPLKRFYDERRAEFTATGLRDRDGEGELDALLQDLAREL